MRTNFEDRGPGLKERTENTSSVTPKAIRKIFFFAVLAIFTDRQALIRKCLKLTSKVVRMMPPGPIPVISRFRAMNWLAPAKTRAEKQKLSKRLIPQPLDNIPKATAAGT